MNIQVQTREIPPSWNDCCGHHGWTEYQVRINGVKILDFHKFDDESHAIETAKWIMENETNEC